MAKFSNPVLFSKHFGVDEAALDALGVLNPTLNVDTRLFIDPMLLAKSVHPEIRKARATYVEHFLGVIKLLRKSKLENDVLWKAARARLLFPEVKWTCLGYGVSVSGSGSGGETTEQIIQTAKQIVDFGVDDPDLFVAMALFEDGFGPDHISDMITNVIMTDLIKFNDRILSSLSLRFPKKKFLLRSGATHAASLPLNPYVKGKVPVLLVPTDILRNLPIVLDWSGVADAASRNAQLRKNVNEDIARLWQRKTLKEKKKVRDWALSGKQGFNNFLRMVKGPKAKGYDFNNDPLGEIFWRKILATIANDVPFKLEALPARDATSAAEVVKEIIKQFRFLVEERRFSDELYDGKNHPRPEKSVQRLFFAVALAYCRANNLDVTPEADTGNGPVDFKFSHGYAGRVLVEIKLSTNGKLVRGYTQQLKTYATAEETHQAFYLVVDVGRMGKKNKGLEKAQRDAEKRGDKSSPIIFVDGIRRPSASKR